jgi:hypothetical protein
MLPHETLFTPTEAAVLTGLPLKAVNNAIDKKTISAVAGEEGARLLDERALISLAIERLLADRFAPELRRQVFDALAKSPRNVVSLEGGLVKIDLREPRRELATSLRELRRAKRLVVSDPEIMGGDPVFRGTRVPVHMIAELVAQGSTPAIPTRRPGGRGRAGHDHRADRGVPRSDRRQIPRAGRLRPRGPDRHWRRRSARAQSISRHPDRDTCDVRAGGGTVMMQPHALIAMVACP